MIQDIYPSKLDNTYVDYNMSAEDFILWFNSEGKVYVRIGEERIGFVTGLDMKESPVVYLFSIDGQKYFLSLDEVSFQDPEYGYYSTRELRDRSSGKELFAVFTAYHLWKWYTDNRYCGRCTERLNLSKKERALVWPSCGNEVYPRINPAVIVGVIKGEKLLITRYRTGYAHIAFSVGSREKVDELTEKIRLSGYKVISGPRTTGDGYYESCIVAIENNQIEITE